MKLKFFLSLLLGTVWLCISAFFALRWAAAISAFLPDVYIWWVIIGIALLPGFLMSSMFFSNLMHWRPKQHPDTSLGTTVLICAHNEEKTIAQTIFSCSIRNMRALSGSSRWTTPPTTAPERKF